MGIKNLSVCKFQWTVPVESSKKKELTSDSSLYFPYSQDNLLPGADAFYPSLPSELGKKINAIEISKLQELVKQKIVDYSTTKQSILFDTVAPLENSDLQIALKEAEALESHLEKPKVVDWKLINVEQFLKDVEVARYGEAMTSKGWAKYGPEQMSFIAHNLATKLLSPVENKKNIPTVVLIERQRFRSGGSANVFESTIKVNLLETALYTALHYNRDVVNVFSMDPSKVITYLKRVYHVDPEKALIEEKEKKNAKDSKKKQNVYKLRKEWKIEVAAEILKHNGYGVKTDNRSGIVVPCPPVELTKSVIAQSAWTSVINSIDKPIDFFVPENDTAVKPKKKRASKKEKSDDLADSFLQGIAWIDWQKRMLELCSKA